MPLTNQTLPAITPTRASPKDLPLFLRHRSDPHRDRLSHLRTTCSWTCWQAASMDRGSSTFPTLKVSAANETYGFYLLGSNDSAFGNGNCRHSRRSRLCRRDCRSSGADHLRAVFRRAKHQSGRDPVLDPVHEHDGRLRVPLRQDVRDPRRHRAVGHAFVLAPLRHGVELRFGI